MAVYNFTLVQSGSFGSANSDVVVETTTPGVSLNDFTQSLNTNDFFVKSLFLSSNNPQQLTEPIVFNYRDADGSGKMFQIVPRISANQRQTSIVESVEFPEGFSFNSLSNLDLSILPNSDLKISFNSDNNKTTLTSAKTSKTSQNLNKTFKIPSPDGGFLEPNEKGQNLDTDVVFLEPNEKSFENILTGSDLNINKLSAKTYTTPNDWVFISTLSALSFGLILLSYKKK